MKPITLKFVKIWGSREREADTPIGTYQIIPGKYYWSVGFATSTISYQKRLKHAIAAAQADFERRVKQCLEVDQ